MSLPVGLMETSLSDGLALVAEARARYTSLDWINRIVSSPSCPTLPPRFGTRVVQVAEQEGNMSDFIVRCTFESGHTLIGKHFLPVIKAKPEMAFRGLEDRGQGIDVRMNLFRQSLPDWTTMRVPEAYAYDAMHRVVWMEDAGEELTPLEPVHWATCLPALGTALAAVHRRDVPAALHVSVDQPRLRSSLIEYPFRSLDRYLTTDSRRARWRRFLAADASAGHTLIHGDLSHKNILVAPDGPIWLLDFDRSNLANPAYDVGFFAAHLAIQAWDTGLEYISTPISLFLASYLADARTGEGFDFCAVHYLLLTLAYRLDSLAFLCARDPGLRDRIELHLTRWLDAPSAELETLFRTRGPAFDEGRSSH